MNKFSRDRLLRVLIDERCSKFVEVGVLYGDTTDFVLSSTTFLEEYWAVDLWARYHSKSRRTRKWALSTSEDEWVSMYLKVAKLMLKYPILKVIRAPSAAASTCFPTNYFDMVFLDADHGYESVLEDIDSWWPLVKEGGLICGDDWCPGHPGVRKAVLHRFGMKNVQVDNTRMWWVRKSVDMIKG